MTSSSIPNRLEDTASSSCTLYVLGCPESVFLSQTCFLQQCTFIQTWNQVCKISRCLSLQNKIFIISSQNERNFSDKLIVTTTKQKISNHRSSVHVHVTGWRRKSYREGQKFSSVDQGQYTRITFPEPYFPFLCIRCPTDRKSEWNLSLCLPRITS